MSYAEALRRIEKAKEEKFNFLDLSKLNLKKIPLEIGDLTNLVSIDLSFNQITEIKGLERLINLLSLDLNGNKITELKGLDNLLNLNTLNLSNNEITEIKGLDNLKLLDKIDLSSNKVSRLSLSVLDLGISIVWKGDIYYEKVLYIKNNPLISPPPEIISEGNNTIKRYLEQLEKEKVSHLYEAKLLIIGESSAGKTTLAKKIKEGIQSAMPTEDDTTRGIEVSTFPFTFQPSQSNEVEQFKMNIWDFGGQEIYHSTHQFFLSHRALYVLVTDGRKQNTHLNYWCQVVELLGENSPMLIVENQKQGHTLTTLNFDAYKARFGFICTPMLRSNFLTTEGLPQVIEEIKHRIQTLPGIGTRLPRTWFNIRKRIEQEAQKKDYISEDEYVSICETEGLNDIDALHLSKDYLHPVGVLLHFQDNPILRNYVILNNAWATDAVYAVLRSDKIVKETPGHFTYQDAEAIWSDAKYRRRVDFLLELMKKFELCYQLESSHLYIAPQLLSVNTPKYNLKGDKKIRIIYEYDFLPKGVLNRLTVRLHEYIVNPKWVWQQGVVLQMYENQAEVIESYDNKKIEINAVGEEPKEILIEIVRQLDKINRTFEKIRLDKKVPCNCSICVKREEPHFYSYESLMRRLDKGRFTIECDISYEDVSVKELVGYLIPNLEDKREVINLVLKEFGVELKSKIERDEE